MGRLGLRDDDLADLIATLNLPLYSFPEEYYQRY